MAQFPVSTSDEQPIYAALELSKNSWLLAISSYAVRLVPRRAPCLLHEGDPERRGRGCSPIAP